MRAVAEDLMPENRVRAWANDQQPLAVDFARENAVVAGEKPGREHLFQMDAERLGTTHFCL